MIRDLLARYPAWARRQGSACCCFHVAGAVLALAVIAAVLLAQAGAGVLILLAATAVTALAIAAGVAFLIARHAPRLAGQCRPAYRGSCGCGLPVTGPETIEGVPVCPECHAAACTGPLTGREVDELCASMGYPEPPRWPAPEPAPLPPVQVWIDGAAEASALRGALAAAPDNAPPEDEHAAAELARVLEQSAVPPGRDGTPGRVRWPERGWTRGHP